MKSSERMRNRLGPTGRMGYGVAGAALVVLPVLVAYREGIAGLRPEALVAAVFGVVYLAAAVLGGRAAA